MPKGGKGGGSKGGSNPNWPSTTGNPSGGGRGNNRRASKKTAPIPRLNAETGLSTKIAPPQFITADLTLRFRRGCHQRGVSPFTLTL